MNIYCSHHPQTKKPKINKKRDREEVSRNNLSTKKIKISRDSLSKRDILLYT